MIGMSKEPTLSSSAARGRRYRQRRRDGEVVIRVEVSRGAVAGLVFCGFLDMNNVTRGEISLALEALMDAIERKAIDSFGDRIRRALDG